MASSMDGLVPVPQKYQWFARRVCSAVGDGLRCVLNRRRAGGTLHFFFRDFNFGCCAVPLKHGQRSLGEGDVQAAVAQIKGHRLQTGPQFERALAKQQRDAHAARAAYWKSKANGAREELTSIIRHHALARRSVLVN